MKLRFACFLCLVLFVGAFLFSHYEGFRVSKKRHPSFSTREIAKTKRLSRSLIREELKNSNLESEIAFLNHEIASHSSEKQNSERLNNFIGLTSIQGDGLEIVLKDSPAPVNPSENPNTGIIHNVDLLMIVNQLWAAGAKAIAINDQRVVASSEINCAGPVIIINQSRISPPFHIQVIGGAPDAMIQKLTQGKSYLNYLASYGILANMEAKMVDIPAAWSSRGEV